MQPPLNLLTDVPEALPSELIETLLQTSTLRIERIISHGHSSPDDFWYDQPTHEWVMLVSGSARLSLEGKPPLELKPGSYINIPAHCRHRVEWTDPNKPTIWLAIHYASVE